jgi:hypothetical protein
MREKDGICLQSWSDVLCNRRLPLKFQQTLNDLLVSLGCSGFPKSLQCNQRLLVNFQWISIELSNFQWVSSEPASNQKPSSILVDFDGISMLP